MYFGYIRTMSHCPYCEKGKVSKDSDNKCPSCNKKFDSIKQYQYKGLGHADLEHAYLAKHSHITDFYSSDKSFKDLIGDPDYNTINFNILLNPSHISKTKG